MTPAENIVRNRIKNLKFQIAFTETNIRYLLDCDKIDYDLIKAHKKNIEDAKSKIEEMRVDLKQ